MGQNFIACDREQVFVMPPDVRDARRLGALLIVHLGAVRHVGHERLRKAGAPVPGPNLLTERSVPGAAR
jgi:hypothetical protein